jgi:PadR family transcriptional regulator PadR
MAGTRRPSAQTVEVLAALAADPAAWRYGYELGAHIGMRSGSLYPILVRLSDRELLDATWEPNATEGRPPRHLYRLTERGLEYATRYASTSAAPIRLSARPRLRGAS